MVFSCGLSPSAGRAAAAGGVDRPYGERAPWNVPVDGLARHPQSDELVRRFWQDGSDRPGNINLAFDDYTFPVYDAREATGWFPVRIEWGGNLDRREMPWNPAWQPAPGDDAQVIVLDPDYGIEWNLWQVSFDGKWVSATNGTRIPGDYRSRELGYKPSRGAGIPYLAMLVRPHEIAAGRIAHALCMSLKNTDGDRFFPPATKVEHPGRVKNGVPEGTRFVLAITDAELDGWLASLPEQLSPAGRDAARTIANALREYGWFITDTSGAAQIQFEARISAGSAWDELGLADNSEGAADLPRDLLDGLLSPERIYAIVPSDRYPAKLRAR